MNASKAKDDNIIKIHLEEYKTLMSEMLKKIEFEHTLLSYTVILPGAIITILNAEVIKKGNGYNMFLLLSPIIFYAVALVYAFNDFTIVSIARYVNKTLRPKLIALVGDASILEYETYQYNGRMELKKKYHGYVFTFCKASLAVLAPIIFLSYFCSLNSERLMSLKFVEYLLFFFDIIVGVSVVTAQIWAWNLSWKTIVE